MVCVRAGARATPRPRARVIAALADKGLWQARFAARLEASPATCPRARLGLEPAVWDDLARALRSDPCTTARWSTSCSTTARTGRPNVLGTHELLRLGDWRRGPSRSTTSRRWACWTARRRARARAAGRELRPGATRCCRPAATAARSGSPSAACSTRAGAARVVTILRLGEVMPSADNGQPNPHALTHFLLSAFHALGVGPDAPLRSDYTPVDHAAARVVASRDGPRGVGPHAARVPPPQRGDFDDAAGRAPARRSRAVIAAASSWPGSSAPSRLTAGARSGHAARAAAGRPARTRPRLRAAFSRLLVDNPRLFRNDVCRRFEARWGLRDEALGRGDRRLPRLPRAALRRRRRRR